MNNLKIFERLYSDKELLESMGYTVLGVFLQGSQNYKLDYEGSDIDTKAIVLPKFEDFVLNKKPASTTHVLPSNEHVDIKDIREMFDCFRKQNINFLEILFTEYRILNPEYVELYQPMFDNNERIAHYNNYKAVNSIAGMVYEKYKALEHPYPATADKIADHGFDEKQLHHMLRCEEFLKRYINGVSYKECLIPTNPEKLKEIKANCPFNLEQAREIANNCNLATKDIKEKYMNEAPLLIDTEIETIMNNVILNIFKYQFKKEICNN